MGIPLFYDADKLSMGMGRTASLIEWDIRRCPNFCLLGKTGVGKGVCAQLMLGRVKSHMRTFGPGGAVATICDFKNEYTFLEGCSRHHVHGNCFDGLKNFQAENERRIVEHTSVEDPFHILLFSEWAMFLATQDKRTREDCTNIMASLIMSVRAQRLSVWIDLQRPDSQWMGTARDSLSPIALGTLSPEAKMMGFPEWKELIGPVGENEGYFSDGTDLHKIVVPTIQNWDKLHDDVRQLVL